MRAGTLWMERFQVTLYLAALIVGVLAGLLFPVVAHPAEAMINPVLGLLLYATFLGVPFRQIGQAFRDWRFLSTALVVNFVLVPVVVWGLWRFLPQSYPPSPVAVRPPTQPSPTPHSLAHISVDQSNLKVTTSFRIMRREHADHSCLRAPDHSFD